MLTYEETRGDVVRLISQHTTRVATGASPMELDSVTKGSKGKGKEDDTCVSDVGRRDIGRGFAQRS